MPHREATMHQHHGAIAQGTANRAQGMIVRIAAVQRHHAAGAIRLLGKRLQTIAERSRIATRRSAPRHMAAAPVIQL
jgi:hypothetical protein